MPKRYDIPGSLLRKLYYEDGMTQEEIAAQFGCTQRTISRRMEEYGMIGRSPSEYSHSSIGHGKIEIPRDELYELYITQGLSAQAIADRFGCSEWIIWDRLNEYEIPIRHKEQVYVPRELLAVWSPALAYVVGLVASDGDLSQNGYSVGFTSTERELTEYYCRCLQLDPDVPIHIAHPPPPRKTRYIVRFADRAYRAFLEDIGLTPSKSKTLVPLAIPDDMFCDFLRGDWDGDGSWSLKQPPYNYLRGSLSCGSPAFQQWVQATVERLTGLHGLIWGLDLIYNGRKAVELGRWLYYAPDLPALSYKREIWEQYAKEYQSPPHVEISYDELYNLYIIQGLSAAAIAERFNCGDDVILRRLRKYGIPVRPRGGSLKRK